MSKNSPFVMVTKDVLDAPAWRAASMGARILYIALKRRYRNDHHNNGKIFLSTRNAAQELRTDTKQVVRWFRELQHFGFIAQTQRGSLGLDGAGRAPHWRLTECGYLKEQPTRDYLRWEGTPFREPATLSGQARKAASAMIFCEGCGVEFKRRRRDTRFCSCSCRQRAFRNGSRNGKRIPVGESPHTHVGESPYTSVGESPHSVTDKRMEKSLHTRRIGVGENTHISSIPSTGAHGLPWSVPVLTEVTGPDAGALRLEILSGDGWVDWLPHQYN